MLDPDQDPQAPTGGTAPQAGRAARPSTIRDVARAAGVGVGTVSRVLNGATGVAPETARVVHEAIDQLGYQPSSAARALSRGRTSVVDVVAPFLTRPSVVERLRGIVAAIGQADGVELRLSTVETPEQRDDRMRDLGHGDRVAGTILLSLHPTAEELAVLQRREVPIILVDVLGDGIPSIVIDDVAGGRLATDHLLSLGHERIGYVGDRDEGFHFTSSADRCDGYLTALATAGHTPDPDLIQLGPHGREAAAELAGHLLDLGDRPTAIFATSDTQALGVLDAARARGIRIPDDLSVIGFDDIELAGLIGLTTVRQPLFESGRRAGELLLELIQDPPVSPPGRIELHLDLLARQTTGPARGVSTHQHHAGPRAPQEGPR